MADLARRQLAHIGLTVPAFRDDDAEALRYSPRMARKRRQPTIAGERRLLMVGGVAGMLLLVFLIWVSA